MYIGTYFQSQVWVQARILTSLSGIYRTPLDSNLHFDIYTGMNRKMELYGYIHMHVYNGLTLGCNSIQSSVKTFTHVFMERPAAKQNVKWMTVA